MFCNKKKNHGGINIDNWNDYNALQLQQSNCQSGIAITFLTFMNNDVDVGSLVINSAEKLTPLQNLAYFFICKLREKATQQVFTIQNLNA